MKRREVLARLGQLGAMAAFGAPLRAAQTDRSQLPAPLLDALSMLHASQIYHRDIAPDNVLLMTDTGRPLLLDFGAARRVIGEQTQALTAILKPGYAPVEQYADDNSLQQGPWTDIYALAAVVRLAITVKPPATLVSRDRLLFMVMPPFQVAPPLVLKPWIAS